MGVTDRFFEAFMVRDHYTMGRLYAEHATFSDPVFPLLNAAGVRLMWQMLLAGADDLGIQARVVDDSPTRGVADWTAYYTFAPTGRRVVNRVHTEMTILAGKIVRQVDTFSFWSWSRQALGTRGVLLGWTPMVREKVRAQAALSLRRFAREVSANQERR